MKKVLGIVLFIAIIFLIGGLYAEAMNPYVPFSLVKPFFVTTVADSGQIVLEQKRPLHFLRIPFAKGLMYAQAVFRIQVNVYFPERPFQGNEQQIIEQIHEKWFDVNKPYTISGGHFGELYTRNFGIFYNAMLDPRIPTSKEDWIVRQRVTLQTLATHLELLKQAGKEYTTFIPVTDNTFIGANFNAEPSDSLFAIVYTLSAARDETFLGKALPAAKSISAYPLQTKQAAENLFKKYKHILATAVSQYLTEIIDPDTGLVKKNINLSSARDSVTRQSSFYDNVIAWATAKDAVGLGIGNSCPAVYTKDGDCDFQSWKNKITSVFWDDEQGLFINDLSNDSVKNHTFTGEEFIVVPVHFFDIQNTDDKHKLYKMVQYVKQNKLDQPFPLFYAKQEDIKSYNNFFVRYFATGYMGESIWSHLGQEYIESLILLSVEHPELLQDARKYLESYKNNIEKYGGYPELYDKHGAIFMTPFYKSMLATGWVINYEQAKMLYEDR